MSINLHNTTPIDQNDLALDALLSQLQGNILKGHGRDHTANIFVEFHPDKLAAAREWLHAFAADRVTSAKKQLAETERFKRNGVPGGLFVGVYLTKAGYDFFGTPEGKIPADASFRGGMENAPLHDPPRSEWEEPFQNPNIHLMILLGDDKKEVVSFETGQVIAALRPCTFSNAEEQAGPLFSPRIHVEYGNAIRNANGDGLEHFGYVDGVSQPLFFKDENERFRATATPSTGGAPVWDPFAPLSLVLQPDPGSSAPDACGSYFVFRKLEQHVRAFKEAEKKLAQALHLTEEKEELAGALVVGRFEDGTPVTLSDEDGLIGSGNANNFNYDQDQAGLKCPFHAHIRKTNPRGASGGGLTVEQDKSHIMARRGIPFGLREVTPEIKSEPEQFPIDGVGLLFMSFQASLAQQFEFIQRSWANNTRFPFSNPAGESGVDPIIGQLPGGAGRDYEWPKVYGQPGTEKHHFGEFVFMRGGGYFFAPSIDTLKNL